MYNFLIMNPGDNPNEGRNKINYNFSLLTGATFDGTFTGDFLFLSGGTNAAPDTTSGGFNGIAAKNSLTGKSWNVLTS